MYNDMYICADHRIIKKLKGGVGAYSGEYGRLDIDCHRLTLHVAVRTVLPRVHLPLRVAAPLRTDPPPAAPRIPGGAWDQHHGLPRQRHQLAGVRRGTFSGSVPPVR